MQKNLLLCYQIKHPSHHHKEKTESFLIVSGKLYIENNNRKFTLNPGDIYHVNKNTWHQFNAGDKGCIFEEISTRAIKSDSITKIKN